MKVLVTGGAGFIGSHLVDSLVSAGHEVRVIDSLDAQVHQGKKPAHLNPRAEYIFDDIRKEDALKTAIEGIDVISHQASAVGVGQSMYEIKSYVDTNTYATAKLLDILVNSEHSVKKLIVASSMSIYGEGSYDCESCGLSHPALRSDGQLKTKQYFRLRP